MFLLQAAAAAETLLVRNVPPSRTAFETIAFVASGLNSIIALLLVILALLSLLVLHRKADELREKIEELLVEMRPMTRNVNAMSDDVREVARNVNGMVDDSRETVRVANERIRASVVNLTDRVDDLSAIIGRVNESAERVATVASTTMAGIKFGARALGLTRKKGPKVDRRRRGRDAAAGAGDRDDGPRERPRLRRRD
jgi:methyl-accepting chemotaxis protein